MHVFLCCVWAKVRASVENTRRGEGGVLTPPCRYCESSTVALLTSLVLCWSSIGTAAVLLFSLVSTLRHCIIASLAESPP